MRNGVCFLRPKLEPITSASGFSCWPSADCNTAAYSNGERGMNLREAAADWPSADARASNDGEGPETFEARRRQNLAKGINGNGMGTPLAIRAQEFPEAPWPTANTSRRGAEELSALKARGRAGAAELASYAIAFPEPWPTADATATRRGGQDYTSKQKARKRGRPAILNYAAATFPEPWGSPRAGDEKGAGQLGDKAQAHRLERDYLDAQVVSFPQSFPSSPPPETTTPPGCAYSALIRLLCRLFGVATEAEFRAVPKSLNPLFVEFLMGWPRGWSTAAMSGPTDCGSAATGLCGNVPPSRSSNSGDGYSPVEEVA
jgi:hypothetical protein